MCPVCPTAGVAGGYFGGLLGFKALKNNDLRNASAVISAGLTLVTIVALKCLFGLSICDGNGDFSLGNLIQVGAISLVMGIIYSIAVNLLLSPFDTPEKSCCSKPQP